MKLLIACDDDTDLQVMFDDLQRAALSSSSQAVVLSAADLLPVPRGAATSALPAAVQRARERTEQALAHARRTAESAAALLRAAFPAVSRFTDSGGPCGIRGDAAPFSGRPAVLIGPLLRAPPPGGGLGLCRTCDRNGAHHVRRSRRDALFVQPGRPSARARVRIGA